MPTLPINTNVHDLIQVRRALQDIELNRTSRGFDLPLSTISATYTVQDGDAILICDTTPITINLPTAASSTGRVLYIKNAAGGGVVTIEPSGSELIDNFLTAPVNYPVSFTITSDGTEWWVI